MKIITIDGLAASGKYTLAKELATRLNIPYMDTGKMYRYAALSISKLDLDIEKDLELVIEVVRSLNYNDIEVNALLCSEGTGRLASRIAAKIEVRKTLVSKQREFAYNSKGAVLDGRDAGTVICPEAEHKFYIKALATVRAKRRYKELQIKNNSVMYASVLRSIIQRDLRDRTRKYDPLVIPAGAIVIDSSNMTPAEVLAFALSCITMRE